MAQVGTLTTVPVKSALTSKINWTQVIGLGAMAASYFGLPLTGEQIAGVIAAIGTAQSIITFIIRTWFTKTIIASSV